MLSMTNDLRVPEDVFFHLPVRATHNVSDPAAIDERIEMGMCFNCVLLLNHNVACITIDSVLGIQSVVGRMSPRKVSFEWTAHDL